MNKKFKYYLLGIITLALLLRYLMHYRWQALRKGLLKKIQPDVIESIKGAQYYRQGESKKTSSRDWEDAEVYLLKNQLLVVRFNMFFDRIKTYKSIQHFSSEKTEPLPGAGKPIIWDSLKKDGEKLKIQFTRATRLSKEQVIVVINFESASPGLEQLLHLLQASEEQPMVFNPN